ncbi:MAG TPA: branched-chain amino acid aminotransferase [Chryseosolibacter sp.]|nr:branched-chain amino acid aminotransferase [Chryseosolibacter sp.]
MVDSLKIAVQPVKHSRLPGIDFNDLPFGKVYSDHMFVADFAAGEWKNFRIIPYGNISVSPATPAIHYGQSIFEGLKAHHGPFGEALLFRPLDNLRRMNISAERMCMPPLPEDIFMESLSELITLDRKWIPATKGSALYIRPFMFSADEYIGIRPSLAFTYMVILSPVGFYYSAPVKVKIETHYTRASQGGTGYAKAGGNYGGSIYPAKLAQDQGYHQLIWTDGRDHQYIEESGTMNVMFVIDDTLVTPALSDSILAGITRDSVLQLARSWGMRVEERKVSVKEIVSALESGKVKEAFGVGTAATIAHIELIGYEGKNYLLPPPEKRVFSNKVYEELDGIKHGTRPDPFGWIVKM